jgi:4-amino-4-deoxy-L-arabinose transferase-like glycosyltransferase/transposase-like protein
MTWARQQAQISRLFYSANQKSIKILATEHPIIIIIIVFIILGYFHSIITPLFVKPDEEWHFAYIAHIRQTGSLPTAMERTKYEGYQAPFYYLLAALLSSPFHLEDINLLYNPNPHFLSTIKGNYNLFSPCPAQAAHVAYLARFLSLFFGAIIVGTTYQIGKIFFPKDVALMGSAGIAFLPTFLFITTAVSNDAAVIAFTTLASLVAVRIIMEGFTIKRGLLFGFFAGMATLSKLNGLILFASVPYLMLVSPGSLQRKIKEGFIYFIGLFVPFPWFVRNWILFGDPFNLYGLSPRPENIHPDMWEMITFIWKSFWLDFSVGRLVYGPSWIYWFYGFVFGLGIVGVLSLIFTHSAKNKILAIVGFFFLQAILILILQLLFSIRHFVGGGRYLLVVAAWCPLTTVSTGPIIVDEYRARRFPMGRKKQIDTSMYFCPHTDCPNYGKVGPDNQIVGAGRYGKANTQLLRCKVCGRTFSARRGTPLFGLKASEETFYDVIACLAEGNGIRATARIKGVDKDTVAEWLDTASKHVEAVSRYLMVNLHFEEAQLDEFWSFVQKKRRAVPLLNGSRPNMATVGSG